MGRIITLDTVKNITIDAEEPRLHNLHAIGYLPNGLHFLADTVRDYEIKRYEGLDFPIPGKSGLLVQFGPMGIPNMVTCCYAWFSVSLMSYLRLVGLVELAEKRGWGRVDLEDRKNQKDISRHCKDYSEIVCPEIYHWRNKVGAHMAITDPYKDDNLGALEFSAMSNITYRSPYYWAGDMQWSTKGGSSDFPRWSLTETFEKLAPRLWPKKKLAPFPE